MALILEPELLAGRRVLHGEESDPSWTSNAPASGGLASANRTAKVGTDRAIFMGAPSG
jgi:hypothetical protein